MDVRVGKPNIEEGMNIVSETAPHECRLRDITYSAPIMVDVEYMRGDHRIFRRDIPIGKFLGILTDLLLVQLWNIVLIDLIHILWKQNMKGNMRRSHFWIEDVL